MNRHLFTTSPGEEFVRCPEIKPDTTGLEQRAERAELAVKADFVVLRRHCLLLPMSERHHLEPNSRALQWSE